MSELNFDNLDALQKSLGYKFKDESLLRRALTHKSTNTSKVASKRKDYERLEFLGDRVLGLIIAETLLATYPKEVEGQISRRFAALVNQDTLAEVATDLELHRYIEVSNLDIKDGDKLENPSILADVMEAIIAAVYKDSTLEKARKLIEKFWMSHIKQKSKPPKDPKTALQEWAQSRNKPLPKYRVTDKSGADHSPIFTVTVDLAGLPVLTAHGTSKRLAEQEVARKALGFLNEAIPIAGEESQ